MTSEEIERTLQLIVRNQTSLSEAQIRFGARQAQLDEDIKQVATSYQDLIELIKAQEERIDVHGRRRGASDEKLVERVNAQVRYEVRQDRLEEAFSQVAESQLVIVQLASIHSERLDGHDNANIQTESRFAALIDAQIQLSQCVGALTSNMATLASDIAALNGCIDRIGAHLDKAVEQINALASAQTRTDEQIRASLEREVSTKPARKSTRTAKKGRASDHQIDSTSLENNPPGEPGAERGDQATRDGL